MELLFIIAFVIVFGPIILSLFSLGVVGIFCGVMTLLFK
jgi:hypothetical protein